MEASARCKRLASRHSHGERNDYYLLHPLRDRSVRQGRFRGIRPQLGPGHPALRRRSDRLFRAARGSATTAYGVYNIESLAAYEAYRARLAADPLGRENYEFARAKKFILKEDRVFLKLASAPHAALVKP